MATTRSVTSRDGKVYGVQSRDWMNSLVRETRSIPAAQYVARSTEYLAQS